MVHNEKWSIIFSVKAEKELSNSWLWYEEIQKGLGDKFIEEVLLKTNKIALNPLSVFH